VIAQEGMAGSMAIPEIIIDEEFRNLLPPLDNETLASLEESLLEYGCQFPLVLWEGILIDGYNRYSIAQKHGLPFSTISMEFESRDDVIIWIISNQVSRRNLSPLQLSFFRGLHYRADKRLVSNPMGRNQVSEVGGQDDHQPHGSTAARLSEQYNVCGMGGRC